MYDPTFYAYDAMQHQSLDAALVEGAFLYRLTSLTHSSPDDVLSGKGPMMKRDDGRFNRPQQPTSYCATNVLTCMAEVLFHMYRSVLERIRARQAFEHIRAGTIEKRALVVFRVREIKDLVYIASDGVRVDYDARISGTTVVFPDSTYEPFVRFSDDLRRNGKKGVFYPSARHSRDICVALFDDSTSKVIVDSWAAIPVTLRLIPEDHDPAQPPILCNPMRERLHSTMGHYQIDDIAVFTQLDGQGFINPAQIKPSGMIDFVRRRYRSYPTDAML